MTEISRQPAASTSRFQTVLAVWCQAQSQIGQLPIPCERMTEIYARSVRHAPDPANYQLDNN